MSMHSDVHPPGEPVEAAGAEPDGPAVVGADGRAAPGVVAGGVDSGEEAARRWVAWNLARAPEPSTETRAIIAGVLGPVRRPGEVAS